MELKAQAQEKISQLARLREESKLKHIAHMHKIEEEQEREEKRNAEARADIKRKRDAADLEEVNKHFVLIIVVMVIYCDVLIRNGAKMNSKRIIIERFKRLSKRKKMHA